MRSFIFLFLIYVKDIYLKDNYLSKTSSTSRQWNVKHRLMYSNIVGFE